MDDAQSAGDDVTAYWINTFTAIYDEARLEQYAKVAGAAMLAGGGRFLARGNPTHSLEQATALRTTLIEFPDAETALAAYNSAAYQEALDILGDAATREIRIVEGV